MDDNLQEIMNLKDILFKKSPNVLKGYQKRFFMIADEGTKLAYFKKYDVQSKLLGAINLVNVEQIHKISKKGFEICYGDRTFELKANSEEQRDKWVDSLLILIKKIQKNNDSIQSISSTIDDLPKKSWKMLDQDTIKQIQEKKEMRIDIEHRESFANESQNIFERLEIKEIL